jgi:hypothetical protein
LAEKAPEIRKLLSHIIELHEEFSKHEEEKVRLQMGFILSAIKR